MIYRDLVNYLGIQGIPGQIGITTITNSGKAVEPNRISFTLNSEESFGESIEVSEAYVLPDLNQSQRGLPQQIDVCNHFHLCDIEFPAVNIMGVPILVGNNISPMHTYRKFKYLRMQGKDFIVIPLAGMFAVAVVLGIPRESQ